MIFVSFSLKQTLNQWEHYGFLYLCSLCLFVFKEIVPDMSFQIYLVTKKEESIIYNLLQGRNVRDNSETKDQLAAMNRLLCRITRATSASPALSLVCADTICQDDLRDIIFIYQREWLWLVSFTYFVFI